MKGIPLELRDYQRVIRKGWPIILAFVLVGLALGFGYTRLTEKVYEANAQVFVATSSTDNAAQLQAGNTFTEDRVQSYTGIAASPAVTGAIITSLKLDLTEAQLARKISADAPQNKVLINLHVTDHNPQEAARLANAVAAQFNKVVEATEQIDATGVSVVKLRVILPATVPTSPIKPSPIIDLGLGLAIGLLLGVATTVLRDALDNTVKGPQDFEVLGLPVLGSIPFDKRTPRIPIAFRGDLHSGRSEAFRQLRTNLQFMNVDNAPRIIAVTSAIPGEGKTATSLNLAAALAEAGFRVCLIEGDLRQPTIAKALGLSADVGFTTALSRRSPLDDVLQSAGPNLAILTSGPIPPNPSELLISDLARSIIRQIAERVDFTIIDTAPLLPVADGAEVAALADATVLVHRAGKSTRDQAVRSIQVLAKVGVKPVGVVLNMVTRGRSAAEYGYYHDDYRPAVASRAGLGVGSGCSRTRAARCRSRSASRATSRPAGPTSQPGPEPGQR